MYAPKLVSVDASQITIEVTPGGESNGAPITSYELFMKETDIGAYTLVDTKAPGDSMQTTVTLVSNGMITGLHYYFTYRSVNSVGNSIFSDESNIALLDQPPKPNLPFKVDQLSSLTSIYVEWDPLQISLITVLGFRLYMDSHNDGNFQLVLDGRNHPGLNYYLVEGLTTGESYRFKVEALNFNGAGPQSDDVIFWSCLPPRELLPPQFISSTQSSLTVDWTMPQILNGCPLVNFELFKDDGAGSDIN